MQQNNTALAILAQDEHETAVSRPNHIAIAPNRPNLHALTAEFGYAVLPILPARGKFAPGVPEAAYGKAPGRLVDGYWLLLSRWEVLVATLADLEKWHSQEAGVGIRLDDETLCIDSDCDPEDGTTASVIDECVREVFGEGVPCRSGNRERRSYLLALDAPLSRNARKPINIDGGKVEFLTKGRQVVAHGLHAKTLEPYRWLCPLVAKSRLPRATEEEVRRFRELVSARLSVPEVVSTAPTNPDDLKVRPGKLAVLVEAMDALPNDETVDRDQWVARAHAARMAFADYPGTGWECFERHSEKYPGYDPDDTVRLWDTMKPENGFRVGAPDIVRWADGGKFGHFSARYWSDEPTPDDTGSDAADRAKQVLPNVYSLRPATEIPPRQFLYGPAYVRQFATATVAGGGRGKSSTVITEGLSMATGRTLLHDKPLRPLRVWLHNGEDPHDEIDRRIAGSCLHYGITASDLGDRLLVTSGRDQSITLASEGRDGVVIHRPIYDAIGQRVLEHGIDVLIIDPFVSSHLVNESDNGAIKAIVANLANLAGEKNFAVHLVHHVRKHGNAEATVEDARGASSLVDATRYTRVLVGMTADEGKRLGVDDHRSFVRFGGDPKNNMSPPPATKHTRWMEIRSVALGNGTPDYPRGDNVGVVVPFKPARSVEQIEEVEVHLERQVVARAVLDAVAGECETEVAKIIPDVKDALNAAKITKSQSLHIIRNKIVGAIGGRDGTVVEKDGRIFRLKAEQRGAGARRPWVVTLAEEPQQSVQVGASSDVFA